MYDVWTPTGFLLSISFPFPPFGDCRTRRVCRAAVFPRKETPRRVSIFTRAACQKKSVDETCRSSPKGCLHFRVLRAFFELFCAAPFGSSSNPRALNRDLFKEH
jgi:hypothetical protein